jgi:hypothetical protein
MKNLRNDYIKANRRASREFELENENGWKSKNRAHKTAKDFSRKPKHKGFEYLD